VVVTGFDIAGATDDWLGIGTAKLVLRRVVVLVVVVVVVVTSVVDPVSSSETFCVVLVELLVLMFSNSCVIFSATSVDTL